MIAISRTSFLLIALAAFAIGAGSVARAQQFIVDVSSRVVPITTGFTGADLLLFGNRASDGEVVVIVRGPAEETVVRKKENVAGIWVNLSQMSFPEVPSFYHVAASGNLVDLSVREVLRRYGIGAEILEHVPADKSANPTAVKVYRDALIRNKQRLGLFADKVGTVSFVGQQMFRTTVWFPVNVATGSYRIEVFEVRNGKVLNATASSLLVRKTGFEAAVFNFAHQYSVGYGLIAIIIAMVAGWLAGMMFRKV